MTESCVIMKIVTASTPEHEQYILSLVDYFYTSLFPDFFTDEEIEQFSSLNILDIRFNNEQISILKNSFEIISSLQTIISIIEMVDEHEREKYKVMFEKNVQRLERYGIHFPFKMKHFQYPLKEMRLSQYSKPDNEFLI
jgi:Family of unknown function (DUF5365)